MACTSVFLRQAKQAGLDEEEIEEISYLLAVNPHAGDVIPGTGGARKVRHRRPGTGKSGGYRTVHYFAGDDVPIFLLSVYAKGQKDSLSRAERDQLARLLPAIAKAFRQSK